MPDDFEFSACLKRQLVSRRILTRLVRARSKELADSSYDVPISLVIRNYNESKQLTNLLESIKNQVYTGPIQIVLQDNGSSDSSLDIARQYKADLAQMQQNEFTYPKGLNLGMRVAKHEVVVITVAHSLPTHNYWLRVAAQHFADKKIAGIYGPLIIGVDSKLHERILRPITLKLRKEGNITKVIPGVLGATNCAIRRSLWLRQPFDEAYEVGAEDMVWANWALSQSYKIIKDKLFTVHHTHGTTLMQFLGEVKRYIRMSKEPLSMQHLSPHTKRRFKKK